MGIIKMGKLHVYALMFGLSFALYAADTSVF